MKKIAILSVLFLCTFSFIHAQRKNISKQQPRRNAVQSYKAPLELSKDTSLLKKAIEGDSDAQWQVGLCYYWGKRGVESDKNKAIEWLEKSSVQGNPIAKMLIADYTDNPDSLYKEACKGLEIRAREGDAAAQYYLAECYSSGDGVEKNDKEALKWYTLSANKGYSNAQRVLAMLYINGYGGVKQSKSEAIKWYKLAAQNGNDEAQYYIACYYYDGDGVPKSYTEAAKWYRRAAEQGYAKAQNELGECYYFGLGVKKSITEAIKWYKRGAKQMNADALYNLSYCYRNAEGVPYSYEKWKYCCILAAHGKNQDAREELDEKRIKYSAIEVVNLKRPDGVFD